MTSQHEADIISEEIDKDVKEAKLEPIEVTIKEKEKQNPTSYDTEDEYNVLVTEEEIKEMTDAQ